MYSITYLLMETLTGVTLFHAAGEGHQEACTEGAHHPVLAGG